MKILSGERESESWREREGGRVGVREREREREREGRPGGHRGERERS